MFWSALECAQHSKADQNTQQVGVLELLKYQGFCKLTERSLNKFFICFSYLWTMGLRKHSRQVYYQKLQYFVCSPTHTKKPYIHISHRYKENHLPDKINIFVSCSLLFNFYAFLSIIFNGIHRQSPIFSLVTKNIL